LSLATFLALSLLTVLARAQPCGGNAECATGFCVDDVCCDSACDATCVACSTVAKGGGPDGVCGTAAAGTVCGPGSCDSGTFEFIPPDTCNAQGSCVDGGAPISCYSGGDPDCTKNACHGSEGCRVVFAPDGYACPNDLVCLGGVCGGELEQGGGGSDAASGSGGSGGSDADSAAESGCGCALPTASASPTSALAAFAVLLLVGRRRRRSSGH
jgi:MYXO-CTERM domain-containing protein